VKLLILGSGAVVTEYYLAALQLLHWLPQVFFIDSSDLALKSLTKVFPQAKYLKADFKEYLLSVSKKALFDAVVVALPNHLHASAVELAMSSGFHVLCEKPLALEANACLRLEGLSREARRVLAVGMVRRYLPSVLALRQALQDDLIGPLQEIDIAWGKSYAWLSNSGAFFQRENAGILADLGVHCWDLVQDLFGPLRPISYKDDARAGVEANAEFRAVAEGSLPVTLILSLLIITNAI